MAGPIRNCLNAILVTLAATAAWGQTTPEEADESKDRLHTVVKGDFNVTISLEGSLDAIKRHSIRCPRVNRGLEVVEVIKDRSEVKKGDAIIRFSKDKYVEELDTNLLQLEDEKKNLQLALTDYEMTCAGIVNDIKGATDQLRTSLENRRKYHEQEAPRKLKEIRRSVMNSEKKLQVKNAELRKAEEDLSQARTNDTSKLGELEDKVENARKAVQGSVTELEKARYDLRVFKQYDYPQKMRALRQSLTQAKMALQRQLVNAEAKSEQDKRKIQSFRHRIKMKTEHIAMLRKSIASLTLTAPVDGIVTLGDPRSWRSTEIAVGTSLHGGKTVATIPDLSRFRVEANLPEEYRSRVKVGNNASLSSKALPDLKMSGSIRFIAPMARNVIRWDKSSPKIYPMEISTDTKDERMMPGMTIQIEILVETVKDVLFIPIECAYLREGKTYCKVRTITGSEEREIKKGKASDSYMEVVEGLEAGDEVLLFREDLKD